MLKVRKGGGEEISLVSRVLGDPGAWECTPALTGSWGSTSPAVQVGRAMASQWRCPPRWAARPAPPIPARSASPLRCLCPRKDFLDGDLSRPTWAPSSRPTCGLSLPTAWCSCRTSFPFSPLLMHHVVLYYDFGHASAFRSPSSVCSPPRHKGVKVWAY